MYFPYMRGKQFELATLVNVNVGVYQQNTIPILEPVASPTGVYRGLYNRLATQSIPLILVMNPFHPQNRLTVAQVQGIVDRELAAHPSLTLGYLIDQRFSLAGLTFFLNSNPNTNKAVIFRYNPLNADLIAIQRALGAQPVEYIVFDDKKTNAGTRNAFNTHPQRVLMTDGFQRQERNSDYPAASAYESNHRTWRTDGWYGVGDYLTVGDYFQAGGGQVYVVALHLTVNTPNGVEVLHFCSTINANTQGQAAQKFAEANASLVNSPHVTPLTSSGLTLFRNWYTTNHNPQLGAAKQASLMHHMELISSLI